MRRPTARNDCTQEVSVRIVDARIPASPSVGSVVSDFKALGGSHAFEHCDHSFSRVFSCLPDVGKAKFSYGSRSFRSDCHYRRQAQKFDQFILIEHHLRHGDQIFRRLSAGDRDCIHLPLPHGICKLYRKLA